jgi:bifunctional non-homologous end joining protein LigD
MSVTRKSRKRIFKTANRKALPESLVSLIRQGTKSPMPKHIKPMLCEKREKPFDGEQWIYELKLDGYRIISRLNKGKVILYSSEQQNYTNRYSAAVDILTSLKFDAIMDGEMIALNQEGKPDLSEIQNYEGDNH